MSDDHGGDVIRLLASDPVLQALDGLRRAIEENTARNQLALARIDQIKARRAQGWTYGRIVRAEEPPLAVELATANIHALMEAGSRLRRAEALALHDEGLPMDQIAELFGVTRQRISEILRDARAARGRR